jgi:hypothetical protein
MNPMNQIVHHFIAISPSVGGFFVFDLSRFTAGMISLGLIGCGVGGSGETGFT